MIAESLFLDFYGQIIEMRAKEGAAACLMNLREDFKHFETSFNAGTSRAIFEIKKETAGPYAIKSFPIFKTRMCTVYGLGKARACHYGDGSAVFATDGATRKFLTLSPDSDELYEITYMALLSVAGEALDQQGFHRVHALGFEVKREGVLVVLPQGGGKSALAALIPGLKIYSDETPLLHGGKIYPYPLRFALKPDVARALKMEAGRVFERKLFDAKELFPFPADRKASPAPVRHILIGGRSQVSSGAGGRARIVKISRTRALPSLIDGMVVGRGVPQMAEFMLRTTALASLSMIAASRLKEAIRCIAASHVYKFETVADAFENARVLSEFAASIENQS
jgi:hypothetical protein